MVWIQTQTHDTGQATRIPGFTNISKILLEIHLHFLFVFQFVLSTVSYFDGYEDGDSRIFSQNPTTSEEYQLSYKLKRRCLILAFWLFAIFRINSISESSTEQSFLFFQ